MTEEQIQFCIYLTGHDRETVIQMYNDWIKFNPKISESNARLNENQKVKGKVVLKGDNKFNPKNGVNFDLKKIIKDNEKDLKL